MERSSFLKLLLIIAISLNTSYLYAQNQRDIRVKVTDETGKPLFNINVLVEDGMQSQERFTNVQGLANFRVFDNVKLKIFAADSPKKNNTIMTFGKKTGSNHQYGIGCLVPLESKELYEIILPFKYKDKNEAAKQLDKILDNLAHAWDLYTLYDLLKVIEGGTSALAQYGGGLGVPGVFSVSPIPKRGKDGKIGFRLSGTLVDQFYGPLICITSLNYNCNYYIEN